MNSIPLRAGAEVLVGFSKGFSVGILCVEVVVESMSLGSTVCTPVRRNNAAEFIISIEL